MDRTLSMIAVAASLAGCSLSTYGPEPTVRPVHDVSTGRAALGLWVINSGDQGSGPIQSLVLQQRYRNGPIDMIGHAAGPGTFQTFTEGALGAGLLAAGTAGAGALIRPATTVFRNIGNSRATGGSATGGAGGAGGAGGSAQASAIAKQRQAQKQRQHQDATATSDAAASTGPIDVRGGGGIIPNGTVLHAPGGDIVVDPTVSVSQ